MNTIYKELVMLILLNSICGISYAQPNLVCSDNNDRNVIFCEDFSKELSKWSIAGSPIPSISKTEGNPAPSFSTNDDLDYGGWAVSKQTFDYKDGLRISFDMKPGHASIPDQRFARFELLKGNFLNTSGLRINRSDSIITVFLTANDYSTIGSDDQSHGPWISFSILSTDSNDNEYYEKTDRIALTNGSGWHNVSIIIRPEKRVEFYFDGKLLNVSTKSLPSSYSSEAALGFGERLSYYDNIMVYEVGSGKKVAAIECWATYENGKLHIPCMKIKGPFGDDLKYEVDLQYRPLSSPASFSLTGVRQK